jgi:hypothetical protein
MPGDSNGGEGADGAALVTGTAKSTRSARRARRIERSRRDRVAEAVTVAGSLRLAAELVVNQVRLAMASAPGTPRQKQVLGRAASRRSRQVLRELDVNCRDLYEAQIGLEQLRGTPEERGARLQVEAAGEQFVETFVQLAFVLVEVSQGSGEAEGAVGSPAEEV